MTLMLLNFLPKEITGTLLAFNRGGKIMMGIHKVKGLWPKVIRSEGEIDLGAN